jgi:hypothetical protein
VPIATSAGGLTPARCRRRRRGIDRRQAVGDKTLAGDDALKFYPKRRPAFNQLAVAKLRFAASPEDLHALRQGLQARLNAGEIPGKRPAEAL